MFSHKFFAHTSIWIFLFVGRNNEQMPTVVNRFSNEISNLSRRKIQITSARDEFLASIDMVIYIHFIERMLVRMQKWDFEVTRSHDVSCGRFSIGRIIFWYRVYFIASWEPRGGRRLDERAFFPPFPEEDALNLFRRNTMCKRNF